VTHVNIQTKRSPKAVLSAIGRGVAVRNGVNFSRSKNQEDDSLEVPQHVGAAEQHGRGVGDVPAYGLSKGVARPLEREQNRKRETRNETRH